MSSPDDSAGFSGTDLNGYVARLARQQQLSGLPPHKRAGSVASRSSTERQSAASRGVAALRNPPSDDTSQI
jgi:hypothetical protein